MTRTENPGEVSAGPTSSHAHGTGLPPHYRDMSTLRRLAFDIRVFNHNLIASFAFNVASQFQKLEGSSRIYEKSYPNHPHLKHRITPPAKSDGLPPLFLDIHGGGFIGGKPWNNDEPNLLLASKLNCLVVSMDYSKSPGVQFPVPTNELIDTVLSVLADSSLTFDRSRIAIGGYSAGGTLSLSVAQSPQLKDKIQAVVAWYPATDASGPLEPKIKSRPYPEAGDVDMLAKGYDMFVRAYLPANALRDPMASPIFAKRETLPKDLLIIGAELDLLCKEAAVMARNHAGVDVESLWDRDVDEKFAFEAEGIKWICVRGARHGFTHTIFNSGPEGEKKTERSRQHYEEVCRWLAEGPFSSKNL